MPLQYSEPTKDDLAAQARDLDVEGRSAMTKEELANAVAAAPSALGATLSRLTEVWNTIGFTTVNDQPVKAPSPEELEIISELLSDALRYIKVIQE